MGQLEGFQAHAGNSAGICTSINFVPWFFFFLVCHSVGGKTSLLHSCGNLLQTTKHLRMPWANAPGGIFCCAGACGALRQASPGLSSDGENRSAPEVWAQTL